MKHILLLLLIVLPIEIVAQDNINQIDSIINNHLAEFRNLIGNDAVVLLDFNYDIPNKNISMQEKDLVLQGSYIDPKKLKKDTDYFLIRFILFYDQGKLRLKGINFRVEAEKRKTINLINLMNGKIYQVKH